jgi:hypothetical protein
MVKTKSNKTKHKQNITKKIKRVNRKNSLHHNDSIVFYDDDFTGNIFPFRKNMNKLKSIHVPENKPYFQILQGNTDFYYPMMFLKKYKHNKYAQELVKGMTLKKSHNLCDECYNVTGQGISIKEINNIIKWATRVNANKNNKIKQKTLLFDWDKTISVCNGIFIPNNLSRVYDMKNHDDKLFNHTEMAQYFSGLIERFHALQLMFFHIRKNNINCHIFTNNGWGKCEKNDTPSRKNNFEFFLKIVQVLDPQMKASDIIYGNGDKVETFKKNNYLMGLYHSS